MSRAFEGRLLVVWLALSAITLVSQWLGAHDAGEPLAPNAAITTCAIGIALFKARVVFREFMEVRHAPALLGRLADLWLAITAVSLLGTYYAGMALPPG